jgi:predicted nuclease with TOPRIM domain
MLKPKKVKKNKEEIELVDISLNSEELLEISKYYERQENYKVLKGEISRTKEVLKKLPNDSDNLKKLFKKSLEKL